VDPWRTCVRVAVTDSASLPIGALGPVSTCMCPLYWLPSCCPLQLLLHYVLAAYACPPSMASRGHAQCRSSSPDGWHVPAAVLLLACSGLLVKHVQGKQSICPNQNLDVQP
jgi:hypothetical protein